MVILGFNCHAHHAAACIVRDGKLLAAAQEERFNRIKVYGGLQPTTADVAISTQTLLATCTFANPAFGSATGGVATAHAITQDDSADDDGTAAWFRVLDVSADAVLDGTVGVGSSFDLDVPTATVVAGQPFTVSAMTIAATYTAPVS